MKSRPATGMAGRLRAAPMAEPGAAGYRITKGSGIASSLVRSQTALTLV